MEMSQLDALEIRQGEHDQLRWSKTTGAAVHASHGTLMAVAFVIIFPLGALATHVGPPGHCRTTFHVACQLAGAVFVLLGFVMGCWLTVDTGTVSPYNYATQLILSFWCDYG